MSSLYFFCDLELFSKSHIFEPTFMDISLQFYAGNLHQNFSHLNLLFKKKKKNSGVPLGVIRDEKISSEQSLSHLVA